MCQRCVRLEETIEELGKKIIELQKYKDIIQQGLITGTCEDCSHSHVSDTLRSR